MRRRRPGGGGTRAPSGAASAGSASRVDAADLDLRGLDGLADHAAHPDPQQPAVVVGFDVVAGHAFRQAELPAELAAAQLAEDRAVLGARLAAAADGQLALA